MDFDSSCFTNDYCPFCYVAGKLDVNSNMNDIKHESNCVWLIAKDLLTVR